MALRNAFKTLQYIGDNGDFHSNGQPDYFQEWATELKL